MRIRIPCVLLAAGAVLAGRAMAQAAPAGDERVVFWLRMWPDRVVRFDPMEDRITGTITTRHGVGWSLTPLHDRRHLAIITGQKAMVEVLDTERLEVVEEHSFVEDGHVVRVDEIRECPGGVRWYVRRERVRSARDRFEILEPDWILYDRSLKETVGKPQKELPRAIRRGARISPDGTKWHVFDRDLLILDPSTLAEEGRIVLSEPLYGGLGAIRPRGEDFFRRRNPAAYRMIYTMTDPRNRNRVFFGRVDLDVAGRSVAELKEWGADPRAGGFFLTAGAREAVVEVGGRWTGGGRDGRDPEVTVAVYEMEGGRKLREVTARVRAALGLGAISADGRKCYFSGRGHELVVIDSVSGAVTEIALPGEIDGRIHSQWP
jgi:hypothetical protein